ncbi:MAG: DUF4843 domain-containing protein [Bacteroidia bacterium]
MWPKFAYRLIALAAILIGLNFTYNEYFLKSDLEKHSDLYPKIAALPDSIDVLYLGESSNITFSPTDIDKRSISGFLGDFYPNLKVKDITQAGAHSRIYYEILAAIADSVKINSVVVTINYRSFSADWIYSKLEKALLKKTLLLRQSPAIYNRFLLSFKAFGGYSEAERTAKILLDRQAKFNDPNLPFSCVKEWDDFIDSAAFISADGNKNWKLTALAAANVKNFAFELNDTNPRIQDFDKIVDLAKKHKWNLVFSIMPENLENVELLVGKELVQLMIKNKDYLVSRYNNEYITIIDNFEAVPHEHFVDKDFPTEHYAEEGRRHVAKDIADALKPIYANEYVEQVYSSVDKRIYFFHNGETDEVWGQMQTLSTEKSYSGEKASKFGKNNPFSLTFDHPLSSIPNYAKSEISFEFQFYIDKAPKDTKLVIEFSGTNTEFSWNAVPLKSLGKLNLGGWTKIMHSFEIPNSVKNADVIKVYLYNPTDQIAYLDDLKIQFK